MLKSAASAIGQISFWEKLTRKRSAGNPHAAFDVAGAGNVLKISVARQFSTLPIIFVTNINL